MKPKKTKQTKRVAKCVWVRYKGKGADMDTYDVQCGRLFSCRSAVVFFNFCPYCGKPLAVK